MNNRRRPADDVISAGVGRLQQALAMPKELAAAVRIFYQDDWTFAGSTFLAMESRPNRIEAEDLLAVTLMGEMFPAKAIRQLLFDRPGGRVANLLAKIPPEQTLWGSNVDDLHSTGNPVFDLWQLLDLFPYVGPTRASKLMARKRPNLIPIYDSIIGKRVASSSDYWYVFHTFLTQEANRAEVRDIQRRAGVVDVPLLRVLDTAVWMRYSGGQTARAVRRKVALPADP